MKGEPSTRIIFENPNWELKFNIVSRNNKIKVFAKHKETYSECEKLITKSYYKQLLKKYPR